MGRSSTSTMRLPQEQVPPHNVEVEQSVLGGFLAAGESNELLDIALGNLAPEAFYHKGHRRIFTAILDLWAASQRPDLITVTDRLRQRGELDEAGGAAYVTSLLDATVTPALLPQHVAILRRDWLKRTLAAFGAEIHHAALDGYEPEQLLALGERMLEGVRAIQMPSLPLERGGGGIESAADLVREQAEPGQPWFPLWGQEGLSGPGLVTLISGHSKVAGKSTSMSIGLRDLHRAHPDRKILILSEEPRTVMRDRFHRWGLDTDKLLVWFADGTPWPTVLQRVEATAPLDVLFVDTIRSFAGIVDENDSAKVVTAMQPLVLLARRRNIAVMAAHHLRKTEGAEGLSHAGSTALVALCDIALELRTDEAENRRLIKAVSRFDITPRVLMIEKTGDNIVALGSPDKVRLHEVAQRVLPLLPAEGPGLTREEIRDALDDPRPSLEQTSRALRLLKDSGRALVAGRGRKGDPYRFCLAETFHSTTKGSIGGGMAFGKVSARPEGTDG